MTLSRLIAVPLLVAALALATSLAHALEIKPYTAAERAALQSAGQPLALHFHADWCPTCRAQSHTFETLKHDAGLPLTLLVADYDRERALKRELGVRTQSTLIVFRGTQETARLAGETGAEPLAAALRSALAPAGKSTGKPTASAAGTLSPAAAR